MAQDNKNKINPFDKYQEKSKVKLLLSWIFVVAVILGIIYMFMSNGKQPDLVCDNPFGRPGLTQFGNCHEE